MFFLYLNFLIAFLSFVALIVIINSSKKNEEPINYYFLIILLGLTTQRFFYSSSTLFNITIENKLNYSYIAYYHISLYYLFIKEFYFQKLPKKYGHLLKPHYQKEPQKRILIMTQFYLGLIIN